MTPAIWSMSSRTRGNCDAMTISSVTHSETGEQVDGSFTRSPVGEFAAHASVAHASASGTTISSANASRNGPGSTMSASSGR